MLEYVIQTYGFLLPIGTSTALDFAEAISNYYDLTIPRNTYVYNYVKKLNAQLTRTHLNITVYYEN
jgi:hypothetical protein